MSAQEKVASSAGDLAGALTRALDDAGWIGQDPHFSEVKETLRPLIEAVFSARLAEAGEIQRANVEIKRKLFDRAVSAETRLAEMERERDEDLHFRLAAEAAVTRAESAEQLLSEMAEGLRAEGHAGEATRGFCPHTKRRRIHCDGCIVLAKYDARPKP